MLISIKSHLLYQDVHIKNWNFVILTIFDLWNENKINCVQEEDEEEEEDDALVPIVLTPQHKGAIRTIR